MFSQLRGVATPIRSCDQRGWRRCWRINSCSLSRIKSASNCSTLKPNNVKKRWGLFRKLTLENGLSDSCIALSFFSVNIRKLNKINNLTWNKVYCSAPKKIVGVFAFVVAVESADNRSSSSGFRVETQSTIILYKKFAKIMPIICFQKEPIITITLSK